MIDLQRLSVALLTVTVLTFPSAAGAKALQDPIPPPPEYHDIRAYGLGGERTVVIAFGAECDPCKASVPFYKRLMSVNGMDGKRNRLVVLSTDGVVPVTEVFERAGFKPHSVISYPRASKLRELSDHAPELVILDASGKPLRTWRGRLSAEQENEVLELLSKGERSVAAARKTSHGPILPVRADDDPVLVLDQQRHPLPGTADFSYTLTRSEP